MTPERLIGLLEEEARLLCEHYDYKMYVIEEDGEYYLHPASFDTNAVYVRLYRGTVFSAT